MAIQPYAERAERRRIALAAALERCIEAARSFATIRELYVYGSFARDTVGPHSDLDLLVVRDTVRYGPGRAEDFIERALPGVPFDVRVLTPREFAAAQRDSSYWQRLLEDARCVYAARP